MRPTRALGAACLVIGLTLGATSSAQTSPPTTEDTPQISDKARALYVDGMKAAGNKNWAAAHAAFLEAWKLAEHYQIAANLGSMEVKLGRYRDACEHLAIYLRKAPQDKVKDRMRAMAFFDEAKKKVGTLQVTANVNGAEILVDDKLVALTPTVDDVFVDPGPRQVKVRMKGYKTAEAAIEASPGSTQQVPLTLAKIEDSSPPVTAPEPPPQAPPPQAQPSSDVPFKPARPVIIAGIAVAAVGVLGGVIFSAVANGQASDAAERAASLRADSILIHGTPYACSTGKYGDECQRLHDLRVGADTFGNIAVWSFVLGGVAGAGTAVYTFVLPKVMSTKSGPAMEPSPAPSGVQARLIPVVGPDARGLMVTGSF